MVVWGPLRKGKKKLPTGKGKVLGLTDDYYAVFGGFQGYSLNMKFLICQFYFNKAEKINHRSLCFSPDCSTTLFKNTEG